MENYIGLFIGIEKYQNPLSLKRVRYAQEDAKGVRDAFIELGSYEDRLELLLTENATLGTIRSKLKMLCNRATEEDVVVFYYAGHGLQTGKGNRVTSYDTSLEDIDDTTLGVPDIMGQFEKCRSQRIIMFRTVAHSGLQFGQDDRAGKWSVSYDQLLYEAKHIKHLAVFSASTKDEPSFPDPGRKHGIWSYF